MRFHGWAAGTAGGIKVNTFIGNSAGPAYATSAQTTFWNDANTLKKYDITVLSCEGSENLATKPVAGIPEMLSPGDIANTLKVSEGDVLAILESGELVGKKIGSTWRIKRSSLGEYLAK